MIKIVTIVGARPQFIKAAPVARALTEVGVQEVLVHTGQHYDDEMSAVFFRQLEIDEPAINLGIGSGSHAEQTGKMLIGIEDVLLAHKPDGVLIYGDTNSTLAAAVSAAKLHIPVAHVEAGLRSHNRAMPEEINRVVADHLSEQLFAPTAFAVDNLRKEGIPSFKIHRTGDVMYDAALFFGEKADAKSTVLTDLNLAPRAYLLATVHRAENTDDAERLRAIFDGLARIAKDVTVVLPMHPRTRKVLDECGMLAQVRSSLSVIDPVGYLDMIALEKNARAVATDSGGVQKEAYFYDVPCATLREETEWVELIDSGWNRLVPPHSADGVERGVRSALESGPGAEGRLYGDGDASSAIAKVISSIGASVSL